MRVQPGRSGVDGSTPRLGFPGSSRGSAINLELPMLSERQDVALLQLVDPRSPRPPLELLEEDRDLLLRSLGHDLGCMHQRRALVGLAADLRGQTLRHRVVGLVSDGLTGGKVSARDGRG